MTPEFDLVEKCGGFHVVSRYTAVSEAIARLEFYGIHANCQGYTEDALNSFPRNRMA